MLSLNVDVVNPNPDIDYKCVVRILGHYSSTGTEQLISYALIYIYQSVPSSRQCYDCFVVNHNGYLVII